MNKFFYKTNLSPITKLCLAGLFIALTTILQKVIAINYISAVPFLRISLGGPALIIFSSILLGPWYGLLVGAGSDILGYFALDFSGQAFFPQVTAIYAVLGFVSYFVFCLLRQIKNKKAMVIIEAVGLLATLVASSLYVGLSKSITLYSTTYTLETWQKILIPSILLVLFSALFIFIGVYYKKNKDNNLFLNVLQLSFGLFVIEVVVMVLFGTFMKGCAFGFGTYPAIVICQIITLFFNVPLNTVLITILLRITKNRFIQK